MNKSYRVVWNASTGTWSAASELTKGRRKSNPRSRRALVAAMVLAASFGGGGFAQNARASTQYGNGAQVACSNDVALGDNAKASSQPVSACGGLGATAVGSSAQATNTNTTAIGATALASGNGAVAVGMASQSTGIYGTAVGTSSVASGSVYSTALGAYAQAVAQQSTAIGANAAASAANSVALGTYAAASAANSVALGTWSTTTANLAAAGYNPGSATLSGTASGANGEVSVGSADAERRITNVAAGSAATDAVNVSQLQSEDAKVNQIGTNTASSLGGGSTYDPTNGTVSAPSYSIGGSTFNNVGGALTNIDGRTTQNTSDISTINNSLTTINGTLADAVQYDSPAHTSVTLGNAGTPVAVTNVAAGAVNAASVDAINGGVLYGVSSSVASALGGGSTVNADGTVSAPSYSIGGSTFNNVGGALTNIDGRVTQNTTDITNVQNQLSSGSIGLVQQSAAGQNLTVGASTD
ncbi:hypothetical protein G3A43_43920, partial [Paraburkholderia aspalathi]|uniref:ESPR domain-containing protein n=1 Tax=Paraburkholderia nemoris TaxID=2793076 RepID=UPI002279AD41